MFATVLHALSYGLGTMLILFVLYGFWRGLGLRPHEAEHRPAPLSKYYWWANE